jgi:hypothetical protein
MSDSNPPASARCDVAQNGWCRVHHSLDCRAVKDALLAQRTKEFDALQTRIKNLEARVKPEGLELLPLPETMEDRGGFTINAGAYAPKNVTVTCSMKQQRDEAREALRNLASMFDPGRPENDYEFWTALVEARRVLSKAEER